MIRTKVTLDYDILRAIEDVVPAELRGPRRCSERVAFVCREWLNSQLPFLSPRGWPGMGGSSDHAGPISPNEACAQDLRVCKCKSPQGL